MSDISEVVNFFSTANEGFTTTLASTITAGASIVPLNNTSGLIDGSIFVGIIEPGATAQQVFTGTVNIGSAQISNVVWTRGTNVGHGSGVTIVDYVTGTGHNMMTAGILKQHTQTGNHKSVITDTLLVTSGTSLPSGDIGTADIADNAITAPKLATNAISLSPVVSVTTTQTGITTGTAIQVNGLTVTVTVPSGGRQLEIETMIPQGTITSGGPGSIFISLWDGAVGSGTQLQEGVVTLVASTYAASQVIKAYVTPSAGSKTYNVGIRTNNGIIVSLVASSTAPNTLVVKVI